MKRKYHTHTYHSASGSRGVFATAQYAVPILNRVITLSSYLLEQQMSTGSFVQGNYPAGLTLQLLYRHE